MKQIQYIIKSGNNIVSDRIVELTEENNIQIGDSPYYLMKSIDSDGFYFEFKYLDSSDFTEIKIDNVIIGYGRNTGRLYSVKNLNRLQTNGKNKWDVLLKRITQEERISSYLSTLAQYINIISTADKIN